MRTAVQSAMMAATRKHKLKMLATKLKPPLKTAKEKAAATTAAIRNTRKLASMI